jgi:hypothetical protein
LSRQYLRDNRVPISDVTAEELLSEIWLKMLGAISLSNEEAPGISTKPSEWTTDLNAPDLDARFVWLVSEIGGSGAITHRLEDIRRQRHGRSSPEKGRPLVQIEGEDEISDDNSDPEVREGGIHDADTRLAWRGLRIMVSRQFPPKDDVYILVDLMESTPELFENSSGQQWPIKEIVEELNCHLSNQSWNNGRVDNAKRRLMRWVHHLMKENKLDAIDLEALFARVARRHKDDQQDRSADLNRPNVLN